MSPDSRAAFSESARVRALHDLGVLDTPTEERFDRLTRLARRVFDVPIALVSLVDSDRQWFKSHDGLDARETPREWSFCSHAVAAGEMLVVEDALNDDRFRTNPLVVSDPSIRFYAGRPITAPGGAPIGTLCIIDREPRTLEADEVALLEDMAELVERELAALSLATSDALTGLSNRRGFILLGEKALAMCDRNGTAATLLLIDLDGFKELNDTLGHARGDEALRSFANELLENYRESDVVARLGGDEFCVLLSGATAADAPRALQKLEVRITARNEGKDPVERLRYSVGMAVYDPKAHASLEDLMVAADALMYENKRERA